MLDRLTASDDEFVIACPECDAAGAIYPREGKNSYTGDTDAPMRCDKCGATFYEAVTRKRREGGSQAKYEHLTPEDVGL